MWSNSSLVTCRLTKETNCLTNVKEIYIHIYIYHNNNKYYACNSYNSLCVYVFAVEHKLLHFLIFCKFIRIFSSLYVVVYVNLFLEIPT